MQINEGGWLWMRLNIFFMVAFSWAVTSTGLGWLMVCVPFLMMGAPEGSAEGRSGEAGD